MPTAAIRRKLGQTARSAYFGSGNDRAPLEDGEMRHGRKSKSKRFNGYKRLRQALDHRRVPAAGLLVRREDACWALVDHRPLDIAELEVLLPADRQIPLALGEPAPSISPGKG